MSSSVCIVGSRILVIGGGVAGTTAAIRFAHYGCEVMLAERQVFPREKACGCCVGAAGLAALDAIGAGDSVRDLGVQTHTYVGHFERSLSRRPSTAAKRPPIRLPIAPGIAVSRASLDTHLVELAKQAGVLVRQPLEARLLDDGPQQVAVQLRRPTTERPGKQRPVRPERQRRCEIKTFDLVIAATGLTGPIQIPAGRCQDAEHLAHFKRQTLLPWNTSPHGPLGLATHLPANHPLAARWPLPSGEIHMVCGDDGYVGLVRLPDGSIDLAAALALERPDRQQDSASEKAAKRSGLLNPLMRLLQSKDVSLGLHEDFCDWLRKDAVWMTTPPLRRSRQVASGRVAVIGDAAGYVEPLTGEGMTWAIESGIAVADLWAKTITDPTDTTTDFESRWRKTSHSLQPHRRRVCGWVTRWLRSPSVRRIVHAGLSRSPWLAKPLTTSLAQGPAFHPTVVASDSP